MTNYNERMKDARLAKGLSYEAAAARASRLLLPAQEFTSSTARRTERGDESLADPIRVWALAQVYEVQLEELSPIAAQWFSGAVSTIRRLDTEGGTSSTWGLVRDERSRRAADRRPRNARAAA